MSEFPDLKFLVDFPTTPLLRTQAPQPWVAACRYRSLHTQQESNKGFVADFFLPRSYLHETAERIVKLTTRVPKHPSHEGNQPGRRALQMTALTQDTVYKISRDNIHSK
jgi:hypothetical protein